MNNHKKNIAQFFVWMRNGIAFCVTWFLMLMLITNYIFHIESVSTNTLIKMVLFVIGGVFIFCLLFCRAIIKKWRFTPRLTCFIFSISIYECLGFYWIGIFRNIGTAAQWSIFIGIIIILYLICILIYRQYSKIQGEIYTQALYQYQHKRSMENGE